MKEQQKQVGEDHYRFDKYVNKGRWNSYYYQIAEIIKFNPKKILEVGVGTGIIGMILKRQGYSYESIDIADDLHPDHVGTVTNLPFNDNSYDVIGCFQVLEHIEYNLFESALVEMFRVARKAVIVSIPDARPVWRYSIHIPKIGEKRLLVPRPFLNVKTHIFDGEHYWEINKKGYKLKDVKSTIYTIASSSGFIIERTYRVWELPYHRFFVLSRLHSDNRHY